MAWVGEVDKVNISFDNFIDERASRRVASAAFQP